MRTRKAIARDPVGRDLSEYEEEEEADDGILKDGQTFRVPLFMKDGSPNPALTPRQRAIAEDKAAHSFGLDDALDLYRPGPRRVTDQAALDRLERAYADYDATDANAWKGDASGEFRGQKEGDVCTINGFPGHLNSKLECVPDKRDALPLLDEREAAYAQYDNEAQNAWRKPLRDWP